MFLCLFPSVLSLRVRHRVSSPKWVVVRQDGTYSVVMICGCLRAGTPAIVCPASYSNYPPNRAKQNESGSRNCHGSNAFWCARGQSERTSVGEDRTTQNVVLNLTATPPTTSPMSRSLARPQPTRMPRTTGINCMLLSSTAPNQQLPVLQEQAVPEVAVLPRCSGREDPYLRSGPQACFR